MPTAIIGVAVTLLDRGPHADPGDRVPSTALVSCTATPSPSIETGTAYTCCEAADVNSDYHPGQTLSVHWIVTPGTSSAGGQNQQVELNAHLAGPYATVNDLKTSAAPADKDLAGVSTFTAEPVRPSGRAGEQPVSLILIPPTATPGYYNLVTSVTEPGATASGASVIHVIPET